MTAAQIAFALLFVTPCLASSCEDLFRAAERDARNVLTIPRSGCDLQSALSITRPHLVIAGEAPEAEIRLTNASAGLRVMNARDITFRDLSIKSSGGSADSIAVTGDSPGFAIERVRFIGGGAHLNLNGATDFLLAETQHVGPRTNGNVIYCYRCRRGIIAHPRIEGYVVPPGGPYRAIEIIESENVSVSEPLITGIDASSQPNFAGIEFVDSHNGSVSGGRIAGMINADGITVGRSVGITVSGVTIEDNAGHPREIPGGGTGSGIDVFGAADTTIVGCTIRRNGHSPTAGSRHHALELYESDGVLVVDTVADDSGKNGILVYGSRGVKLVAVSASRNQESGLLAFAASGKAQVRGNRLTVTAPQSFGKQWRTGRTIRVGGKDRHVESVSDNDHLTLQEDAGSGQSVPWSFESTFTAIDSTFNENGVARIDRHGFSDGVSIGSATRAVLIDHETCDPRAPASRTQRNGLRHYADALVLTLGSASCTR